MVSDGSPCPKRHRPAHAPVCPRREEMAAPASAPRERSASLAELFGSAPGAAGPEGTLPVLRRLLSCINQRTAMCADGEELLAFDELPAFAHALGVAQLAQRANGGAPGEDAKPPPKVALLQRQLVAAVHQYFRKRWPLRLPDWSEEERARGLDRATNNRTLEGFSLDLRAVGVEYINAALVSGIPPSQVSYVVTQHPLQTSISDFWKMVVAVQPAAILMLNGAAEPVDIDLPPYWLPSSLPGDGGGPELEAAALHLEGRLVAGPTPDGAVVGRPERTADGALPR